MKRYQQIEADDWGLARAASAAAGGWVVGRLQLLRFQLFETEQTEARKTTGTL